MTLLDQIVSVLAPFNCLSCGQENWLLCPTCRLKLAPVPAAWAGNLVDNIYATTLYTGLAKELIRITKFERAQAGLVEVADLMATQAQSLNLGPNTILVPVTTTPLRRRQRGYDQAVLLTKHLARQLGRTHQNVLIRLKPVRQLGASRTLRLQQLTGAYMVSRPEIVANQHILLVDDVVTTGATLESAASALLVAGAESVNALVFAKA